MELLKLQNGRNHVTKSRNNQFVGCQTLKFLFCAVLSCVTSQSNGAFYTRHCFALIKTHQHRKFDNRTFSISACKKYCFVLNEAHQHDKLQDGIFFVYKSLFCIHWGLPAQELRDFGNVLCKMERFLQSRHCLTLNKAHQQNNFGKLRSTFVTET